MKIGFFSPYFDGFGGGERYTLTLASYWSKHHSVDIFWDHEKIVPEYERRFRLDLSRIHVVSNIFTTNAFFLKLATSAQYDVIFFLSDGSIPTSLAKHNILHFQVPFQKIHANWFKMSRFDSIICNSLYTKNNMDPEVSAKAEVIYPPVSPIPLPEKSNKEKIILSVGRFSSDHAMKKHELMIKTFISAKKQLSEWKLVLLGGLLPSDNAYFDHLTKYLPNQPITLLANVDYSTLKDYYQRASIYWHSAGFGESDPQYFEHFGISTVEAMSAGCVPVVFGGGGQAEIVTDKTNGFLWETPRECIEKTMMVVKDIKIFQTLQKHAYIDSRKFSESHFVDQFDSVLDGFGKKSV